MQRTKTGAIKTSTIVIKCLHELDDNASIKHFIKQHYIFSIEKN